jgi:hypothetical protein
MPHLGESSSQPYDYTLRSTVPLHRDTAMEVEGDVHAGAMYRPHGPAAKQAIRRWMVTLLRSFWSEQIFRFTPWER